MKVLHFVVVNDLTCAAFLTPLKCFIMRQRKPTELENLKLSDFLDSYDKAFSKFQTKVA